MSWSPYTSPLARILERATATAQARSPASRWHFRSHGQDEKVICGPAEVASTLSKSKDTNGTSVDTDDDLDIDSLLQEETEASVPRNETPAKAPAEEQFPTFRLRELGPSKNRPVGAFGFVIAGKGMASGTRNQKADAPNGAT